jgi:protein lifeguard
MWLFYFALVGSLAFIIPLACCKGLSKEAPMNYLLLLGFALCESYLVSMICSLYTPESVLQAAAATCAATFGLTAYALKTKSDFTECTQWMLGKKPII